MCDRLHTVKKVSKLLGIREHGVLSLIHSGELRGVDVSLTPGGRPRWRIMQDDLDGFLLRRTRQASTPRRRRRKKTTNVKQYF